MQFQLAFKKKTKHPHQKTTFERHFEIKTTPHDITQQYIAQSTSNTKNPDFLYKKRVSKISPIPKQSLKIHF